MTHDAKPAPHYLRIVTALALGAAGVAVAASCSTSPSGPDVTVGGGSFCQCPTMDAGSTTTSGACAPDQLDAGCNTLLGAGPLMPPDLPARA